jgi:hypothetical protein
MRGTRLFLAIIIGASATIAGVSAARAEPTCGTENLLTARKPVATQGVRGDTALLTDGAIAAEGTTWDAPAALILESSASTVTFDLGEARSVSALYVQADANDTYKIAGALEDKPDAYKVLAEVPNVVVDRGHGLRGRTVTIPAATIRYLRIGEGNGDGYFSLSEVAAYCKTPTPFPPPFRIVAAPAAPAAEAPAPAKRGDGGGSILLLAIAALGLAWLAYRTVKGVPEEKAAAASSTPPPDEAGGAAKPPEQESPPLASSEQPPKKEDD